MAKKILIIDDDRELTANLAQVLKSNQYETAEAYGSSDGLKKLLSEKPDLIILDVMMESDTAGFEMAFQIRDKRETSRYKDFKNIPIIIMTAINQTTNNRFSLNDEQSFLPRVSDFLTKPVKIEKLLEKIKKYI
jgi:CheY-like chemotaxis protein